MLEYVISYRTSSPVLITPCVKRRGVISNTGRRGSGLEVKVFVSFELSGSIFTESSLKTLETMLAVRLTVSPIGAVILPDKPRAIH
ncbi:MAG: hypothetical protein V9G25_09660 [Acidimicrobiia bacterium]